MSKPTLRSSATEATPLSEPPPTSALSIPSEALHVPYLRTLTWEDWLAFKEDIRLFRHRGGTIELHKLMSLAVLDALELETDLEFTTPPDDDKLISEIDRIFAPAHPTEAMRRFGKITMTADADWTMQPLRQYAFEWRRLHSQCSEAALPPLVRVIQEVLCKLVPPRLKTAMPVPHARKPEGVNQVCLRADEDPFSIPDPALPRVFQTQRLAWWRP